MPIVTRPLFLAGAVLLHSACAHRPTTATPREQIVMPAPITAPATTATPPVTVPPMTGPMPSLTMPSEWQHHNGEDYDDLFDRMRAGFAFPEVQEPAINEQLAWFCL